MRKALDGRPRKKLAVPFVMHGRRCVVCKRIILEPMVRMMADDACEGCLLAARLREEGLSAEEWQALCRQQFNFLSAQAALYLLAKDWGYTAAEMQAGGALRPREYRDAHPGQELRK